MFDREKYDRWHNKQLSAFGPWEWNASNVDAVLLDPDNNDVVQLNKLIDMFTALEVVGLREGSLIKLYEAGYVTSEQIITASKETLQSIIGEAAGAKVYDSIKHRLNPVKLGILAGSSQILGRGIGRRKMTKLVAALGEDNVLYHTLVLSDVVKVESFDIKTGQVIIDRLPAFKEFLSRIAGYYTLDIQQVVHGGVMSEVKVCFTGVRDKDLEKVLESKGATVQSSVNKETTHLVAKDPNATSGKLQKARDMGVAIIGLDEAQELWN